MRYTHRRVTLLTDFGTRDGYAASLRGVIASSAPHVHVDDCSHDIPPGDIEAGAWALDGFWMTYPEGTVHLVVVDPGVGGARRAIIVEAAGRLATGPDNGVLEPMLVAGGTVRIIRNGSMWHTAVAPTFHGRDIFAPVAAYLASGGLPENVGPTIDDPVRLAVPAPQRSAEHVVGLVVHIDRFGNLITNIPAAWMRADMVVEAGGHVIGQMRTTYADVRLGDVVAVIGSRGMLELSVRDGNAAVMLALGRHDTVRCRIPGAKGVSH